MKALANSKCATFNEFFSDALTQENQNNIYSASKSHKRAYEAGASQPKASIATRPQFHPLTPKYRPPQKKVQTSQTQKVYHKAFFVALPKGSIGQGSSSIPPSNMPYWNCNKTGHWAINCPYPKKNNNQKQGNPNARQEHMYYTTLEEIPSGEVVTTGMFLVNHHPAVVLFDSRASHSFMSPTFASKYDQKIFVVDKGGYCISAAGSNISTNQIVKDVRI